MTEEYTHNSPEQKQVKTMSELIQELKLCDDAKKLIFIKAGAEWCEPCKNIQPFYNALIEHWSGKADMAFIKFNIDDANTIASYFQVESVPYFICLLPHGNTTLTLGELRYTGSVPSQLERWFANIMQKWIIGNNTPDF